MTRLLQREFTVNLPLGDAWQHLSRVEDWPSWATHIKRVELHPPSALGAGSTGVIRLRNGVRSAFTMTEFDPPRHWKWVGKFLWLTVQYDHAFEQISQRQTKLSWSIDAEGVGVSVLGRLFAAIYARNLDRAIPKLIEQMNTAQAPAR